LLCMFNGFAFGWPSCEEIKVKLTGVELTPGAGVDGRGCRAGARR
jgi:hypothetical protein